MIAGVLRSWLLVSAASGPRRCIHATKTTWWLCGFGHAAGPHTSSGQVAEDGRRELGNFSAVAPEDSHIKRSNKALDALKLRQSRDGVQNEVVRGSGRPALHRIVLLGHVIRLCAESIHTDLIERPIMSG